MIPRDIRVKVLKKNQNRVTIKLMSSNSKMVMRLNEFKERVKDGTYRVMNKGQFQIDYSAV